MQSPSPARLMPKAPSSRQPKSILLVFSHLRWNFVFQRPQHLFTRAAQSQPVLFFEEPIFEGATRAHLRLSHPQENITVATPILPRGLTQNEADLFQRSLLSDLLARNDIAEGQQRERLVTWYFTPMALRFSRHLQPSLCVYDCMDELSQFRGAPQEIRDLERDLMARAGLVFTGGQSLFEAKRKHHANAHCFPSSIDAKHFGKARGAIAEPHDQACIPHKRIGFFGVIDERLDVELLDQMAQMRPEWQFVILGPVVKIDPASLPRHANIHWLGQKNYDELPAYLAGWDLGMMPFALNEATRFISPTKTPEFLAAGLPVVSSAVHDVVRTYGKEGHVEIAGTAEEFIAKAAMLLERTDEQRQAWLARVDAYLATTSWDRTWASMASLIEQNREHRQPQTARVTRLPVSAGAAAPAAAGAEGAANV
jgi:hypothetical protein